MKCSVLLAVFATALAAGSPIASAQDWAGGDAEKGKKAFNKCMTCHRIGDDAKNMVGPILTGIVGRTAGMYAGFSYSALNKNAGENGLVWTEQMIFEYLPNPNNFLKKFLTDKGKANLATGSTKMVFNLPNAEERKDIIAFLKTFPKKD